MKRTVRGKMKVFFLSSPADRMSAEQLSSGVPQPKRHRSTRLIKRWRRRHDQRPYSSALPVHSPVQLLDSVAAPNSPETALTREPSGG